jgi:hypothetical protein
MQIEGQLKQNTLPIIRGSSYELLEKLINDASCYEPQTQQELFDDMNISGDDALSIEECLELLHLAHTYSAVILKQKYSMLCSFKLHSGSEIKALEGGIKSDDPKLALVAFRLVCDNLIEFIREKGMLESLPKIFTALLELTCASSVVD